MPLTEQKGGYSMVIIFRKVISTLWDNNITVAMLMALKKDIKFYMPLCGNYASKYRPAGSLTACYVHVLL
jgi:hypothetical protein